MTRLILCLFLFLATFCGVSNEYQEAVKIDGTWYAFYRVTIENDEDCDIYTAFGIGLVDKDGNLINESAVVAFGPIMVPGQIEEFCMIVELEGYEENPNVLCTTVYEPLCEQKDDSI